MTTDTNQDAHALAQADLAEQAIGQLIPYLPTRRTQPTGWGREADRIAARQAEQAVFTNPPTWWTS